jgi:hypothetical protein
MIKKLQLEQSGVDQTYWELTSVRL